MKKNISYLLSGICAMTALASCDSDLWKVEDDSEGTFVPEECSPISTTLDQSGEFSEWVKVLNYSETYSVLNALYDGVRSMHTYTTFAPSDSALQAFYASKHVSGIEELGVDYAKALVRTMTYDGDSIKLTEKFTANVDYYVTEYVSEAKQYHFFTVDEKQGGFQVACVMTTNDDTYNHLQQDNFIHLERNYIKCTNGFVYKTTGVFTPLVETVYQRVQEDGKSTIMAEALRATGYDKELAIEADTTYIVGARKIVRRKYTLLNVTDEVFAQAGIHSLAELKSAIADRATDKTADPDSLLRQYVEYHLFDGTYNHTDLVKMDGADTVRIWETLAKNQILMISRSLDKVEDLEVVWWGKSVADTTYHCYFNTDDFADQLLDVHACDNLATNGIVHNLTGWMPVYEPKLVTVVWDLAAYSAVRNALGTYYQPSAPVSSESKYSLANLDCYTVEVGPEGSKNSSYPSLTYMTCKAGLKDSQGVNCLNNDRVVINVGCMGSVKMMTPTLTKGKYKVSVRLVMPIELGFLRTQTGCKGGLMRVYVDGDHKLDTAPYTKAASSPTIQTITLYDELEFAETRNHEFKIVVLDPAASTNNKFCLQFDAIIFEPIIEE